MLQAQLDNVIAQLEVSKQMYNEAMNQVYAFRTSNLMLQKQVSELNNEIKKLNEPQVEAANDEVDKGRKKKS